MAQRAPVVEVRDMAVDVLAGQVVIGALEGEVLPEVTRAWLAEGRLGGVTLFGRNVRGPAQVASLCRAIVAAAPADLPPVIAVDQEGGRVARMKAPVLELPPMRRLGVIDDPDLTLRAGRVLGRELAALGFNLDFAPVCDVDSNPDNPVIGDRAFARDPERVAAHAVAFARGLREGGVLACAKHFPGHGDTTTDSHTELPVLGHDRARLDAVELPPFRAAVEAGVDVVMTAHVVCRGVDADRPATLSPPLLAILKDEMRFGGMLVSDDLNMKAIRPLSVGEAAVRAVAAGCDAVLVCRHDERIDEARQALADEARRSPAFLARLRDAVDRCLRVRRAAPPAPAPDDATLTALLGSVEHRTLAAELAEHGARVSQPAAREDPTDR